MDFKKEVEKILRKVVRDEIFLDNPSDPKFGDYAFPCFNLAKKLKKNPAKLAQELRKKITLNKNIERVEAVGPYLNFFVSKKAFVESVFLEVIKRKDKYGSSGVGKRKRILMEHTSFNPNASPHVGRARNALIGDCLTRILRFQDYKVDVHYFINDVGKQVAMLGLGSEKKSKLGFNDLLDIYVDINKEISKNPLLEKKVFELLNKLEKGDKQVKNKFKHIVDVCIKGQVDILSRLGIKYDSFDYESKYLWDKSTAKILNMLEKTRKLSTDSDGRKVLNEEGYGLAMKTPVLVLTRADGTSLYALRDIAYTIEKMRRSGDNIVVLGEEQKLYFQQIKIALELLKYKAPRAVHYSFVLLSEGKMSTRKGNLVLLEDFMAEAVKKAELEIKKRRGGGEGELAEIIGFGALKYGILKVSPEKNVFFDWKNALNFEGETGSYVQYAHARACSILRKAKIRLKRVNFSLLNERQEISVVKRLSEFPDVVLEATNSLKPSLIANYVYELAQKFNEFYHNCPCLSAEDDELVKARLSLVDCVRQVLENGLNLLGIKAPEKM